MTAKPRRPKAADITDRRMAVAVDALSRITPLYEWDSLHMPPAEPEPGKRHWVNIYDVAWLLGVPAKVARAKLRRMVLRGHLSGCWCSCSGQVYVTRAGSEALGVPPYFDWANR